RRLHEREPAVEIVADDEAGHCCVACDDPDLVGLVDDVADRRDQAVLADPDTVAHSLGAEQARAHCVRRYPGADRNHCVGVRRGIRQMSRHRTMLAALLRAVYPAMEIAGIARRAARGTACSPAPRL